MVFGSWGCLYSGVLEREQPDRKALLAALLLISAAAGTPAILGSWVYDDWGMLGNPLMDGADDLVEVFSRHSGDFLSATDPDAVVTGPSVNTYRPVTAASLIALLVVFGESELPQHIFSWALHALVVIALAFALLDPARRRPRPLPSLLLIGFALHPAWVEAHGWINGRSDVMAGLALAVAAALLVRVPDDRSRLAWRCVGLFLCACVGLWSKEVFAIGMFALLVASLPWDALRRAEPRGRAPEFWLPGLAVGAGIGLALALRASVIGLVGGRSLPLADALRPAASLKLMALTADGLLAPRARVMRNLAWEFAQPISPIETLCAALAIGMLLWALRRRRWATVVLLSGAAACMLPTAFVSNTFWLGLDRYLYLPGILTVLAISRASAGPNAWTRGWLMAATGLTIWLAAQTYSASLAYASEEQWLITMTEERPSDPSGPIAAASWFLEEGDAAAARQALARVPLTGSPPALARAAALKWKELREPGAVIRLLEDSRARFPEDPYVAFDVMGLRAAQGRLDDALQLASELSAEPHFCAAVGAELDRWAASPRLQAEHRERASTISAASACADRERAPGAEASR